MNAAAVPVITIDGPSGTGKGTIAKLLAKALGWHLLDSGILYRAIGWAVLQNSVDLKDKNALSQLLAEVPVELIPDLSDHSSKIFCGGKEVTAEMRSEEVGSMASKVSALPVVRAAVLEYQRQFRVPPGLVTDGRDMGTVVFPDASLKLYLDAELDVRVKRRYQQLVHMGHEITLSEVKQELIQRDNRDSNRSVAPLKPAADAHCIDTSELAVAQVFSKVMALVHEFVL